MVYEVFLILPIPMSIAVACYNFERQGLAFSGEGLCRRLRRKEVKAFSGDEEGVLQRGEKNKRGCWSLQG